MTDFLDALEARLPGEVERRARSIDRRRVSRAIDRALAPAPRRTMRTRVWVGLAAAAVLVAASAAAAISHARSAAPMDAPVTHAEPAPPIVAAPKPTVATVFEPAMSVDDLPRAVPTAAMPAETSETAAELFANANRTRQSGDVDGAIALYQKLERRFPASNEAVVAHVSLGRALLDRDARGALAEYERYLASGAVDLREEALVGRARAFGKLSQSDDEKRAWQTLLAEHPDSLHAMRAKERIAALP
jgi:TolA-binding protein